MSPERRTTGYARIRSTPATEALGLAGRVGSILGESQPSASRVPVVGEAPDDFALAVHIRELKKSFWLAPEFLEPVNADGTPFVVPPERPWRDVAFQPPPPRRETPVTRFLGWLEQFLPRL